MYLLGEGEGSLFFLVIIHLLERSQPSRKAASDLVTLLFICYSLYLILILKWGGRSLTDSQAVLFMLLCLNQENLWFLPVFSVIPPKIKLNNFDANLWKVRNLNMILKLSAGALSPEHSIGSQGYHSKHSWGRKDWSCWPNRKWKINSSPSLLQTSWTFRRENNRGWHWHRHARTSWSSFTVRDHSPRTSSFWRNCEKQRWSNWPVHWWRNMEGNQAYIYHFHMHTVTCKRSKFNYLESFNLP